MLHYTWMEGLARYKHCILLGAFISYEENEVLWLWPLRPCSQHFNLELMNWPGKLEYLSLTSIYSIV